MPCNCSNYPRPLGFFPIQEAGIYVCRGCGVAYLLNEATEFSSICDRCGDLLQKKD
ncbi:MAG: hypothetical protein UW11_C0008G0008 [Parcubacteria group bacterium GW2011_GWA2_43_9b]|nr:MAG: hypothetical protein UW11_C0008G0008 [Parcubacteria group bacterium GW2011_GWA2_43_9b]